MGATTCAITKYLWIVLILKNVLSCLSESTDNYGDKGYISFDSFVDPFQIIWDDFDKRKEESKIVKLISVTEDWFRKKYALADDMTKRAMLWKGEKIVNSAVIADVIKALKSDNYEIEKGGSKSLFHAIKRVFDQSSFSVGFILSFADVSSEESARFPGGVVSMLAAFRQHIAKFSNISVGRVQCYFLSNSKREYENHIISKQNENAVIESDGRLDIHVNIKPDICGKETSPLQILRGLIDACKLDNQHKCLQVGPAGYFFYTKNFDIYQAKAVDTEIILQMDQFKIRSDETDELLPFYGRIE